eukprot:5521937-Amphidinium_carterae.1
MAYLRALVVGFSRQFCVCHKSQVELFDELSILRGHALANLGGGWYVQRCCDTSVNSEAESERGKADRFCVVHCQVSAPEQVNLIEPTSEAIPDEVGDSKVTAARIDV